MFDQGSLDTLHAQFGARALIFYCSMAFQLHLKVQIILFMYV